MGHEAVGNDNDVPAAPVWEEIHLHSVLLLLIWWKWELIRRFPCFPAPPQSCLKWPSVVVLVMVVVGIGV